MSQQPPQPQQSAIYRGRTRHDATRAYHDDALRAAEHGYVPIGETWAQALGQEVLTVTYAHAPAEVAAVRGQILASGLVRSANLNGGQRPVGVPAPVWGAGTPAQPRKPWSRRRWVAVAVAGFLILGTVGALLAPPKDDRADAAGVPPQATGQPTTQPTIVPTSSATASAVPSTPTPEPPLGTAPTGLTETATVVRVVDGDTIIVDRGHGEERLRYIGVDTPETVDPGSPVEWMGPEATAANKRLVEGQTVVLEKDVSETDQFDRLLRYVWVTDGGSWTLVNLALLAQGVAQVATFPPDVRYVDLYLAQQTAAREAEIGLWGAAPTPEPTAAPTPEPTARPTAKPTKKPSSGNCDPSYPDFCVPPAPPDLDCDWVYARGESNITVIGNDPHRFDGDNDGLGCEGG